MYKITTGPVFTVLIALTLVFSHADVFTTSGDFILKDGEVYFIEGVGYSPYYPGESPTLALPHKFDPRRSLKDVAFCGFNSIYIYSS